MSKALEKVIRSGVARAVAPEAKEAPVEAQASSVTNVGIVAGTGNGFSGADSSDMRGMVYFPQLDTRREINPSNRLQMLRRGRWLYNNVGFAKHAVDATARMVVGTGLVPEPFTDDKEWNELALEVFNRRTGSAAVFDLSQKYNFKSSQRAVMICKKKDGDMGCLLSNSQTGRARFGFYEAHQIGTAKFFSYSNPYESEGWYDGVNVDRFNAARAYRILGDLEGEHVDVDARNFLFQCDYDRPGQRRGVTVFAHAINNLLDVTEIQAFLKTGIKQANRVGYYLADKGQAQSSGGIEGKIQTAVSQVVDADGNKINIESVYGQGGEIPNVPSGKELRLLADQRPHPNTLGFLEFLIRDIALGMGISSELLWDIAKLGGANTRYVLADAQSFIEREQQQLVDQYCHRVWAYTIAKEMKAGSLRPCNDPDWLFKCGWITPARITVDFGRDGTLHQKQLQSGMLTFKQFYGWKGQNWKPQLQQWVDERAYIAKYAREEHDLNMSELMAILPSQASTETDPDAEDDAANNNNSNR